VRPAPVILFILGVMLGAAVLMVAYGVFGGS